MKRVVPSLKLQTQIYKYSICLDRSPSTCVHSSSVHLWKTITCAKHGSQQVNGPVMHHTMCWQLTHKNKSNHCDKLFLNLKKHIIIDYLCIHLWRLSLEGHLSSICVPYGHCCSVGFFSPTWPLHEAVSVEILVLITSCNKGSDPLWSWRWKVRANYSDTAIMSDEGEVLNVRAHYASNDIGGKLTMCAVNPYLSLSEGVWLGVHCAKDLFHLHHRNWKRSK